MVYSNETNGDVSEEGWNEYVSQYMQKIETINANDHKPPPRQQINIGIFHEDVICNNNLVLVLKWSSNNVACVKQETALAGIPFPSRIPRGRDQTEKHLR